MSPQQNPLIATKPILNVREAAAFLGISESMVRKLIYAGRLRARRLNSVVLLSRDDLLSLVDAGQEVVPLRPVASSLRRRVLK